MAAEVMAMALPLGLGALAGARSDARRAMVFALVIELVFLGVTRTRGAWFGATLGLGTTLLLLRAEWSRASIAAAAAVLVVTIAAAVVPGSLNSRDVGDHKRYSGIVPLLRDTFDTRSTALRTRMGLWRRTLVMVREHPLLGVGAGNWPVAFPRYAEPGAAEDGVLSATLAPRQAHNDFLQLTAESGLVGMIALGLLILGTVMAVRRRLTSDDEETRATTAGAAGALVALVALCFASFPFEMPGTLTLGGLALGLVAVDPFSTRRRADPRWVVYCGAVIGVVLVLGAALRAERSIRSSRWLGAAERSMRVDHDPAETLRELLRASDAAPNDFRMRLRMAQALLAEHRAVESADAARHALSIEPYSPNAWAALAAAELEEGEPVEARHHATQALTLLQDFPFALQLRSAAAQQEGDPANAQADRERLRTLATSSPDRDTSRAANKFLDAGN
jgi:hypothetical protein